MASGGMVHSRSKTSQEYERRDSLIFLKLNSLLVVAPVSIKKTYYCKEDELRGCDEVASNAEVFLTYINPSAWGHLNPSSYCDVGRLFYGVFKLWPKLQRKN